jgi:hypothetical protein
MTSTEEIYPLTVLKARNVRSSLSRVVSPKVFIPGLSPGAWWWLAILGAPWLVEPSLHLCLPLHMSLILPVNLSLCPNLPFFIRTPVMMG